MANFNGTARSNYFRVKDAAAFKAWVQTLPDVRLLEQPSLDPAVVRYGIASECPDSGCFPSVYLEDHDANEDRQVDYPKDLGAHLLDGEVCVLMQAGAEQTRYISGWAQAFDNTGKLVTVSLNDIYDLAQAAFGIAPGTARY